ERVRYQLRGSYSHHYRRMLAPLLAALEFKCDNAACRPVMDAVGLLARYAHLAKPAGPAEFIADLKTRLRAGLDKLDTGLTEGATGGARIITRGGKPWASVPKLGKLPEPGNLAALKAEALRRWGTIDLLDILKNTAFITDFTGMFTSVATREVLDRDTLNRRLLLVLFALGTNMGIRQMAATGEQQDEAALRHVRATCITRENLRAAIVEVVNGRSTGT
ncbi:MAG: Tn3 family transposase, partial [Streptosporangiaceae bacterium]